MPPSSASEFLVEQITAAKIRSPTVRRDRTRARVGNLRQIVAAERRNARNSGPMSASRVLLALSAQGASVASVRLADRDRRGSPSPVEFCHNSNLRAAWPADHNDRIS